MEFIVKEEPRGKERPRFCRNGNNVYTPRKTKEYEELIGFSFLKFGGKKVEKTDYVAVSVDAYFKIPKSYTKGRRIDCQYNINRPTRKPDADNILKAVLDGLNGVAYDDDRQVVDVKCRKWYTLGEKGYLSVSVNRVKKELADEK